MNLDLSNKTALVCGSTQGIGKASAIELATLGATVVLMARNETTLQQTLTELPKPKRQAHRYLVADFSKQGAVTEAIRGYLAENPNIHILVNNTGGPQGGPIIEAEAEAFIQAFHNHLLNNQALVQAVLPGMKQSGYGRIVNIISTSVKQPIEGLGVSNTIRGAVAQWAKTLSLEIARFGITVNNVLPGYTETARLEAVVNMNVQKSGDTAEQVQADMQASIPTRRFATAEEVAAAVAFLCTPAAASINGINLPVDGGRTGSL